MVFGEYYMTFGLVILTFNEIEGLTVLWDKIPKEFDELFAVDGGSTDGTIDFFKEQQVKIVGQSKKGRGEAFRIAFRESTSDVLIFFSPDGNENCEDIKTIKREFEKDEDIDLIIASRMMKESKNEEDDQLIKLRKWANNGFNLLANLIFNKKLFSNYITDSINGFRGFRRNSFNLLNLDAPGYTIEYQATIRCFKKDMMIKEIPTIEAQRIGGESYAKSIPTGIAFIKCLIREILSR
jgi:glycosyltransferase involved in cell wall biosynthesis